MFSIDKNVDFRPSDVGRLLFEIEIHGRHTPHVFAIRRAVVHILDFERTLHGVPDATDRNGR